MWCSKVILSFLILGVLFLLKVDANLENDCKYVANNSAVLRLKRFLLCEYEKSVRPVKDHKNVTNVDFHLSIKYIELNRYSNEITVHAWMILMWKDEFLTWEPNSFGDIEYFQVSSDDIWLPDLAVFNSANLYSPLATSSSMCIADHTGGISCVMPNTHNAICIQHNKKWPFNTQTCELIFGSWSHSGEEINITLLELENSKTKELEEGLSLNEFVQSNDWHLQNTSIKINPGKFDCCPDQSFPSVQVNFTLLHHATIHSATLVAPAFGLMVLNLIAALTNPLNPLRIYLAGANLFFHICYLQTVVEHIYINGDECPSLILFYRDSLFMVLFQIALTIVIRVMFEATSPSPRFLSGISGILVNNKLGQMIFLETSDPKSIAAAREDYGGESGSLVGDGSYNYGPMKSHDWMLLGKLLDKVFFLLYAGAYAVMFERLLP